MINKYFSAKVNKNAERRGTGSGVFNASAEGFKIEPNTAIIISLLYVGVVIVLHIIGKYNREDVLLK